MTPRSIRFGPFEFDPASGELLRDGVRQRLQPQPARLLDLLLTRRGELVTREDIRKTLWGEDVHVDFERSLNFCVRKLRLALDDDADSPRFVETIPTRGYRFIAATDRPATPATGTFTESTSTESTATQSRGTESTATEFTDPTATESAVSTSAGYAEYTAAEYTERTEETEPSSHGGRVSKPGALMRAIVVVLALGAAVGVGVTLDRYHVSPPKIVVVPFHNETGSPDFDRVAKGVSDAAVARLASPDRLPRLRVIGNATDVFFSFRPHDMKAMGQALGAQYLVLGQLKKDNSRFRVIAHLIRVSDQTHVWATTFDRATLDLPTQSEIAEDIARAVSAHLPS